MFTFDYLKSDKSREDLKSFMTTKLKANKIKNLNKDKIPRKLYKYTHINKYSIKDLLNDQITATCPTEFNDLYDSTMHIDSISELTRDIERSKKIYKEVGIEDLINKETEEMLIENAVKKDKHMLNYLTKEFRVACLSSDNTSITMWSHYADDNKGICIEYDYNSLNSTIQNLIFPVMYIDTPFDVTELCREISDLNLAILASIISKFRDWEYEKEWRLIMYMINSNEKWVSISVGKPSCIYLGTKFIDNYKLLKKQGASEELHFFKEFINYVEKNNIRLKKIKPQIRSYELQYDDIEFEEISCL